MEWNRFCTGTHPCYNGKYNQPETKLDGSKNNKDFVIGRKQTAILYRKSHDIKKAIMVLGTMDKINNPKGEMSS